MALEEKRAWIAALVTGCGYVSYLVIVLGSGGDGPLAETPYVSALLWTVGVAILVAIVLGVAAGFATPRSSRRKDERDREIERFGEHVGQSLVAVGGGSALAMAMAQVDHFWIANAVYLAFALSGVLTSVTKIFAYRRGFPTC